MATLGDLERSVMDLLWASENPLNAYEIQASLADSSGKPHAATAAWIALPASSEVPGWAGCALASTGQPAASAEAVSPPATENASGKLLAPNTATGPSAIWRWRKSDRGRGRRAGWRVPPSNDAGGYCPTIGSRRCT